MDDAQRRLWAIPARPVPDILAALAAIAVTRRQDEARSVPRVTLHLTGGAVLNGTVIDVRQNRHDLAVVLQSEPESRHEAGDAIFVSAASIQALTVRDAATWAEVLAGGQLQTLEPVPTRLAARRALAEDAARAGKAVGKDLTWTTAVDTLSEGPEMRALAVTSKRLADLMVALAGEPLGKTALAALAGVELRRADKLEVAVENAVLRLAYPSDPPSVEAARTAVEAVL